MMRLRDGLRGVSTSHPARTPRLPVQDCDCALPTLGLPRPPGIPSIAPTALREAPSRRRRIWDLGTSLHCSIIGTCLSTDELRRLLRKAGAGGPDASDHALHGIGVGMVATQGVGAKLVNKALDERHRAAIRRFEAAKDVAALRSLWREAMAAGEIPGAYWAALTHPCADQALVSDVFGDVHMLSHLVGAANRADIRRLAEQDKDIAALREKVARQQQRLQVEVTDRDARIRTLQELLAARTQDSAPTAPSANREMDRLIGDLQSRLHREIARREACEAREAAARRALVEERAARQRLESQVAELAAEVAATETTLGEPQTDSPATSPFGTVLYVGGRSGQTTQLRRVAERVGAELLHFDAEQGAAMLPGLVGRADLVVFPVDCVSHDAALGVKRLCRQLDRPFRPLRSTGAASLLAALREVPAAPG